MNINFIVLINGISVSSSRIRLILDNMFEYIIFLLYSMILIK